MIRLISSYFMTLILLVISTASQAIETLTVDNKHSYVLWSIEHLGFSTQTGKWYVNGELTIDKDNPQNSQIKITINMNDVVTGITELDKHLRGKLFFDTAQFPTATFVSDKVEVLSDKTAKVQGMLTLHGVSKPISLDVTLNKVGKNPISEKMTAGFSATTTIKRSDFGMNTLQQELGDSVKIEIAVEAYQAKS